ncbi:uncharacterized protein LOC142575187 [Dermacentor variabilis]|uniref:uncharacterized protein LOC142575187 n=1 Tax=Dermacentor variabilis TaxID=34621 RepID=UPI003F5BB248
MAEVDVYSQSLQNAGKPIVKAPKTTGGMVDETVKVAVRVRPPFPEEQSHDSRSPIEVVPENAQLIVASEYGFSFDYTFDADTTQEELYTRCVADLIGKVTTGYNCCVLMYGQTGSGKTYTMGTDYDHSQVPPANEGIIPRALRDLFACLTRQQEGCWTAKVSFLEIYNESVFDLLATPKDREAIPIREVGKVIVLKGLVHQVVESPEEALRCLAQGCRNRSTGATLLNSCSSRSHAIFSIHLQGQVEGTMYTSKLQLVDLAGSEAVKRTHSIGDRRKEGVSINLGLLALGNVINSLCSHNGKPQFIPYRDSSLTRLLRDSLNGGSFTVMIACISPAICNIPETINTLRYADRARQIKMKPVINKANKENILHRRHFDFPPPFTPSHWQSTHQTPLRTPLRTKAVCSSVKRRPNISAVQLESTLLAPATEEDTLISSSDNTSFTMAENLSPVRQCPTLPLTPLVERLCERLEPSLRKDIGKKLESFMAQSYLDHTSTTAVECTLTEEQQTLLDALDTTLQEQKRRTMSHTPLQDATNTPLTVKKRKLSGSGTKVQRTSWKSSPEFQQPNLRRSTQAQNENGSVLQSSIYPVVVDTPGDHSQMSPAVTEAVKPLRRKSVFVSPNIPQSCIASRTRRSTTIFNQRPADTTPGQKVANKGTCATCRKKPSALGPMATPKSAQLAHNKTVLKLLNLASERKLQLLAKVGPKKARMIYLHRTLRGQFETFEDLKKVEGLGGDNFFKAFMSANILTK